jgi:hypothetical protein
MEINTTKETLNINKIICEKKEIINIQGDMIVPDAKPDILNTITARGNVCIYKKEILDGKLRVDGTILTYIMYLADGNSDNIRGLNTGLDFSETINIPELETGMIVEVIPIIKSIECKVINGRKIGIKVTVEIMIKVHSKEQVEIITGVNADNIQRLSQNSKINLLLGNGETRAFVKENISIPSTDSLAEILSMQISLVDKDIKISYNKVLAKSEIEIKMSYLTEDGRICKTQTRLPLVGFIDMPNIKEENICETSYMIRNILIKPNSIEEHSVYIELETEIYCMAYEEKEIKTIQDMYCPGQKMEFDKLLVNTITDKQCQKSMCNIREKINFPEMDSGSIIDVAVNPIINKENRINNKVLYEGDIELNFMFSDNSAVGVNSKKIMVPFEQTIEGIPENCRIDTNIEVNSQEFSNQLGIVNANLDLKFETNAYRTVSIPIINNITTEEFEELEDYSVIIYVVKNGDTLWKIAKRFGSTVDDIVRVNGIENKDRISEGEKLYIPKTVRTSINYV